MGLGKRTHTNLLMAIVLIPALLFAGCQTRRPRAEVMQPSSEDKRLAAIYSDLKNVPIPIPETTPFDGDSGRRNSYLEGFRQGWDFAISGRILYATPIAPAGMQSDLFSVWQDGAREGRRLGSERLTTRLGMQN